MDDVIAILREQVDKLEAAQVAGDVAAAAVAAATIAQEVHMVQLEIDPGQRHIAAIVRSNGRRI